MAQSILITLTTAGSDTGPFGLYSNLDGYTVAFESGISRSTLLAGYLSTLVPDAATSIRVKSEGAICSSFIDLDITGTTTTTTTAGPTTSTTSSTSTTEAPVPTTTTTTTAVATVSIDNDIASGVSITSPLGVSGGGVFTVVGGSFPINPGEQVTGRIIPAGTYDLTLNGIRSILGDHRFKIRGSDLVEDCQDMDSDDGGTISLVFSAVQCLDTQSGFNLDVIITAEDGLCS